MKQSTTDFNQIYNEMFYYIQKNGVWSSDKVRTKYIDGTPAKRKQVIGYQFRFDNSTEILPVLESRFTPLKDAIRELYWIWIKQSNKVQDLKDLGCNFWNEWEKEDGTIGPAYGYQIAKEYFGHKSQLHYILHEIKNNPDSTRIMTELWSADDVAKMALTPCVHLTQWSVVEDRLFLEVRVRSQDFALGLVSNIYQYANLHRLVAKECNVKCADIIYSIHNLHYYDRHEDLLIKQIENQSHQIDQKPTILKNINCDSIWDFTPDSIEIETNNKTLPKIKFEIAV